MKIPLVWLAVVLFMALVSGCADQDRYANWKCGENLRVTLDSQVVNPSAGGDKPVTGMDGTVAMHSIKRYEKMGEEKKKQGVLESMADMYKGNQESK